MRRERRSLRRVATGAALTGILASIALLASSSVTGAPGVTYSAQAGHKCLVMTGSGDPAFTKNFNPYAGGGLPTNSIAQGAFYEPLIAVSAGGVQTKPWLARSWKWSNGNKTLTLALARNAKWSDGTALTSADVVYSLLAGRQDKTMDRIGITGAGNNIASIKAKGKYGVVIKLKAVDSQFIAATLNRAFVVPQHIWSKVADPATFTNPNPVGSGPFNRIARFTTQDYVLNKNPNYWQAGLPKIACLEYVQASSNDAALALIQSGQADWTHNFVPNVESAYQDKDPAHYHNAYLTTALPVSLTFNTTQYPYSLVAFRKGVSQAIDRKSVSKLGEYGYAPATTALGLEQLYPKWMDPALKATATKLATYDPDAAKKTFTDGGFSYKGGKLMDPKGNPVSFQMHVIGGWSDWVASLQIVSRNLQAVGIDASVKIEPDWAAWTSDSAVSGTSPSLIWSNGAGDPTPYAYFFSHFDPSQLTPTGQDALALGNFERNSNLQGTAILKQFKGTLDKKKQLAASYQLQKIFLDELPYIPLFIGPRWSTYSTKYVDGFVTWKNQYADPIFSTQQQVEISLLSLFYADAKKKPVVPALPSVPSA